MNKILLLMMIVMTGCAGAPSPEPTPSPTIEPTATATAVPTATPTLVPIRTTDYVRLPNGEMLCLPPGWTVEEDTLVYYGNPGDRDDQGIALMLAPSLDSSVSYDTRDIEGQLKIITRTGNGLVLIWFGHETTPASEVHRLLDAVACQ